MGKKPYRRERSSRRRAERKGGSGGNARWPLVLLGALVVGVGSYAFFTAPALFTKSPAGVRHRVPGGERRPTLSPALFGGVVARAYQIAREIPEVLDELYCYCFCIENHGHRSNLSCFVDSHAAG